MKKPNFNFNSILSRLFISFLLVITPILITGIIMFTWGKQTIKNEIENSAVANISFLKSNLESEIENIKMLQYNLTSDIYIERLISEYQFVPNYDYYTLISDVQQRLRIVKNSNKFIEDVVLYVPGMGHSISVNYGYIDFDKNEYNRALKSCGNDPLIVDNSGIRAIMICPANAFITGKDPSYLVEIIVSRNMIENFLAKFNNYNESDTALYDHTSGNWLFCTNSQLESTNEVRLKAIENATGKSPNTTILIGRTKYYVISDFSKYLNFSFVEYVPMGDIFRVPDRYVYFLWIYAAMSLLIIFAYSFSTYKFVKYPVDKILKSFRRLEEGDLSVRIQLKAANEFNYLFEGFNKMVCRLNELINRVYKQEIYAKKSELKQLQSQINPHFLYNSYFMLHRMIKDQDLENAQLLSSYLGKYFQYITRNASEEVMLCKEVEHARSYAQIQELRFAQKLNVEFGDIPEKYQDLTVLRMILQPILENSIEHGLKNTLTGGLVRILFTDISNGLDIVVEDNGENLSDNDIEDLQYMLSQTGDNAETTGMLNVHKRLELKYGRGSGITVSRSMLGGLKVEMKIVLRNPELSA